MEAAPPRRRCSGSIVPAAADTSGNNRRSPASILPAQPPEAPGRLPSSAQTDRYISKASASLRSAIPAHAPSQRRPRDIVLFLWSGNPHSPPASRILPRSYRWKKSVPAAFRRTSPLRPPPSDSGVSAQKFRGCSRSSPEAALRSGIPCNHTVPDCSSRLRASRSRGRSSCSASRSGRCRSHPVPLRRRFPRYPPRFPPPSGTGFRRLPLPHRSGCCHPHRSRLFPA